MYRVVVNIWIERSDNLVGTKRIGSNRSFKLLARFLCLLSYSQGMFEYPEKRRFPSKLGPVLKRPIDPWWLCILSLIW